MDKISDLAAHATTTAADLHIMEEDRPADIHTIETLVAVMIVSAEDHMNAGVRETADGQMIPGGGIEKRRGDTGGMGRREGIGLITQGERRKKLC
jgi:hypothetical protein